MALENNVRATLTFWLTGWWDEYWRYLSVSVGFLYTLVLPCNKSFYQIAKTLKKNGFASNKCSFKNYMQNHNIRKTEKLKRFTSIPYVQGVSEPISRILTQVGIGVALKPHHTLSSLFRKPKDVINFEQKRGLVYQISCRDCNAVYVGETGRSVRTRKREHADAVKTFNTKKSALSQHVMDFDHRIDWDNVKILKSESHAYRRRVAESFLINQKGLFM